MNKGFRNWARPRNKAFVGSPQVIDTTSGNKFYHNFGRVPGQVTVQLVCVTANNGFVAGNVMPFHILFRLTGADGDGIPRWFERHTDQFIEVWVASANVRMQTTSFSTGVAFTASQWKVVVRCKDIEPVT